VSPISNRQNVAITLARGLLGHPQAGSTASWRSAGFQPAVSPISNRQNVAITLARDLSGHPQAGSTASRRSAGFQPAVSPISNRQNVAITLARGLSGHPQAGSTAIQQVGNLRYGFVHRRAAFRALQTLRGTRACPWIMV